MQKFPLMTIASAPEKTRQTLQALEQKLGFLPNALATMANSPVLLNAFVGTFGSFHGGSFDPIERQVEIGETLAGGAVSLETAVFLSCPLPRPKVVKSSKW